MVQRQLDVNLKPGAGVWLSHFISLPGCRLIDLLGWTALPLDRTRASSPTARPIAGASESAPAGALLGIPVRVLCIFRFEVHHPLQAVQRSRMQDKQAVSAVACFSRSGSSGVQAGAQPAPAADCSC